MTASPHIRHSLPIVLLLLFLCPGCRRLGRTASAGTPGSRMLRIALVDEVKSFDPALSNDTGNAELLQNVFEGLVIFDENNRIAPLLARSWTISPDDRTYTFHLREGVRFHNGRPFTAADVKWSWERALRPKTRSQNATNYLSGISGEADFVSGSRSDVSGLRILDDLTLQVTLDKPQSYFLGKITLPAAWVVCREAVERGGGHITDANAIGTGAFTMAEYRSNNRVVLHANPDYWGGRPPVDRIERPIVLDPAVRQIKFENDELDVASIVPSDYVRDLKSPSLRDQAHAYPAAGIGYLTLHPKLLPQFRDPRVRLAIARAIDRDAIVRLAFEGVNTPLTTVLPAGIPGAAPADKTLAFDPPRARALLAEAGYPGGSGFPPLTLVIMDKHPDSTAVAQVVRGDLKKNLGITVNIQEREFVSFNADTTESEKVPFYYYGWVADYLDAQDFLSTLLRTGAPLNHYGYSNREFDRLCDQADVERDEKVRAALYHKAEQIALSEAAVVPLNTGPGFVLVKPRVKGFRVNLLNALPLNRVSISDTTH